MKLTMLKPRLPVLDTGNLRGLATVGARRDGSYFIKPARTKGNATGRDADPRRTLPLNSSAWQRLRASVLSSEPLCRHCTAEGRTKAATDLDHRDGNPGNNDILNLCPLCHEHHSRKTQADRGHKVSMGCDVNGYPLGSDHHWNQAEKSPETLPARPTVKAHVIADCKETP